MFDNVIKLLLAYQTFINKAFKAIQRLTAFGIIIDSCRQMEKEEGKSYS
jgi:hypothetical protein